MRPQWNIRIEVIPKPPLLCVPPMLWRNSPGNFIPRGVLSCVLFGMYKICRNTLVTMISCRVAGRQLGPSVDFFSLAINHDFRVLDTFADSARLFAALSFLVLWLSTSSFKKRHLLARFRFCARFLALERYLFSPLQQ